VEGLADLAFRRHHAQIVRYLSHTTGDADRAEDLAQEVFLDATIALSGMETAPVSLPALLHTIAKRRVVDDARRRRVRAASFSSDGVLDELPAEACDGDDRCAVFEAIEALEPRKRGIIAMRLLRGYSFCEVAISLGISEAAAKMRFQRAMGTLRADLERRGLGS
jgi:RNA polymerase sigma-70 factor (ECF subfamily)